MRAVSPSVAVIALLVVLFPSLLCHASASPSSPPSPSSVVGCLKRAVALGTHRAFASMSSTTRAEAAAAASPSPATSAAAKAGVAAGEMMRRRMTHGRAETAETNGTAAVMAVADEASAKAEGEHNRRLSSFVAGIGSGALASVVCAPLDLIRTRMQVMGEIRRSSSSTGGKVSEAAAARLPSLSVYRALQDIMKQDGFRGCFRGLGATLATVPAFWGIYFPLYEETKKALHARHNRSRGLAPPGADGDDTCPPVVHMTSAVLAGAVADLVCNPMFLVRTRMQTEALHYFERPVAERTPHGVWTTVRSLYAEGGIPVFWRGLTASLMGLSHVAIQFPVYEFLKAEARADSPTGQESAADLLLASGVAKMCASLVTYPHEVVRSRMMDARGDAAGQNVVKVLRRLVQNEGFGSLYAGIHVSLLRVVPNCCITFMSYEMILRWAKEQTRR